MKNLIRSVALTVFGLSFTTSAFAHHAKPVVIMDSVVCKRWQSGDVSKTTCSMSRQGRTSTTTRLKPRIEPRIARVFPPELSTEAPFDIPNLRQFPDQKPLLPPPLSTVPGPFVPIPPTLNELPYEKIVPEGEIVVPPTLPCPEARSPQRRLEPPKKRRSARRPRKPVRISGLDPREAEVLMLLNRARLRLGLGQLTLDHRASIAARAHSEDMCNRSYFSHRTPEGRQPWDRLRRAGARFGAAAENIAAGYMTARSVHEGWLRSPGHRANRLTGSYTRMGVGLYDCHGKIYWTEVFLK